MALTGFPAITKYAADDSVFVLLDNVIINLTIAGWRVEVDYDNDGVTGRQRTYYNFTTHGTLELTEDKVFSSKNHLLGVLKGAHLNAQTSGGGNNFFTNIVLDSEEDSTSFAYWVDLAHFDLTGLNFLQGGTLGGIGLTYVDGDPSTNQLVFDGAKLTSCTLPVVIDTKAEFKTAVKSYDKVTTIWTDGNPIG